jgi:hypothetical protein
MGEAVIQAKYCFAPLNAHTDTNRMGWTSLATAEVEETQEQFPAACRRDLELR